MNKPSSYYKFYRNEMIPFLPDQYFAVLEIGCGEGYFRNNLTLKNEYWGIEPEKNIAMSASNKLDKVLVGTYLEMYDKIPDDYFDLVVCNDVIEHMIDTDVFFQTIKKKLKKDAYLIASIPNVRYLLNLFDLLVQKDWEYKDAGILDNTHRRFFTEKSLKRTINENGFLIEEFRGINSFQGNTFLRRLGSFIAIIIFGNDVRFMQFGLRIKNVN